MLAAVEQINVMERHMYMCICIYIYMYLDAFHFFLFILIKVVKQFSYVLTWIGVTVLWFQNL